MTKEEMRLSEACLLCLLRGNMCTSPSIYKGCERKAMYTEVCGTCVYYRLRCMNTSSPMYMKETSLNRTCGYWKSVFEQNEREDAMELNEYEQKICKALSKRDADGYVHCLECPLVMDREAKICRATVTKEDWEDMVRWAENGYR